MQSPHTNSANSFFYSIILLHFPCNYLVIFMSINLSFEPLLGHVIKINSILNRELFGKYKGYLYF